MKKETPVGKLLETLVLRSRGAITQQRCLALTLESHVGGIIS